MNSFWIELDSFFCQTKINFTKSGPLATSKMELFVTIVDNWKLLTSVSSSLDPTRLNYYFQRTEKGLTFVSSSLDPTRLNPWKSNFPYDSTLESC